MRALALLLFAWQALVLPTHAHANAGAARVSAAANVVATGGSSDRRDEPADCPICRAVSHAGPYLLPGDTVVALPRAIGAAPFVAAPLASVALRPLYTWRSRAPPAPLHA